MTNCLKYLGFSRTKKVCFHKKKFRHRFWNYNKNCIISGFFLAWSFYFPQKSWNKYIFLPEKVLETLLPLNKKFPFTLMYDFLFFFRMRLSSYFSLTRRTVWRHRCVAWCAWSPPPSTRSTPSSPAKPQSRTPMVRVSRWNPLGFSMLWLMDCLID